MSNATFWQYAQTKSNFLNSLQDAAGWGAMTDAEKTEAYNNYVSTLPVNSYGVSGSSDYLYLFPCASHTWSNAFPTAYNGPFTYSFNANSFIVSGQTQENGNSRVYFTDFSCPINGSYTTIVNINNTINIKSWGSGSFSGGISGSPNTSVSKCQGDNYYSSYIGWLVNNTNTDFTISGNLIIRIAPTDSTIIPTYYNTNTRPAGLVNNCTISNAVTNEDNTSITNIYNLTAPIIDESTLVFTNPATSITTTMSSWWYDYSTRTYHLTDASSNEHTVCYGDESITITEGDVINTFNYCIDGASSNSGPIMTYGYIEDGELKCAPYPIAVDDGAIRYCGVNETLTAMMAALETPCYPVSGDGRPTTAPAYGKRWSLSPTLTDGQISYAWEQVDEVDTIEGRIASLESSKVTTITADSTDGQYPSAKAVWDLINGLNTNDAS